jgi:hypothetical protein
MTHIEFEVGKKYENMKGIYEVLSIDRNTMRIRWDSGEEISTTVSLQSRIIIRMSQDEPKPPKKSKKGK